MHHCHSCECKHGNVMFCKDCQRVWCQDCGKEWEEPCNRSHYWPWTYTSGGSYTVSCDENLVTTCSHS
jgi:hypothetical protein